MTDLGDRITLTAAPRDDNGDALDVAALALSVTLPDGTSSGALTPTHDGEGAYSYAYTTVQAGRHVARWAGTGYAYTDVFNVWPADPHMLFSLADAKKQLRWAGVVTDDDEQLRVYIAAATAVIEDIVGPVIPAEVTETFDGGDSAILLKDMNVTVTEVTVDGATLVDVDDYTWSSTAGVVYAGSQQTCGRFATGSRNTTVTYTTAATVPDNVRLAAEEELRFLWQIGQQGNRPGFGDVESEQDFTPSGYAVPRRVIELCGRTRRKATRYASA